MAYIVQPFRSPIPVLLFLTGTGTFVFVQRGIFFSSDMYEKAGVFVFHGFLRHSKIAETGDLASPTPGS